MADYTNPWIYQGQEVTSEMLFPFFGFVYLLTDTENGRLYVGKKHIWNMRKVKGKNRRQRIESDWKKYYSSHPEIKALGKVTPSRFKREILHLCTSLGMTNWREIEEQFLRKVLYDDRYYNDQINGKWYKENVRRYQ